MEAYRALTTDRNDLELRDTHVFLASQFAAYPILIYTSFDLSALLIWIFTGISIILWKIGRRPVPQSVAEFGLLPQSPERRTFGSLRRTWNPPTSPGCRYGT